MKLQKKIPREEEYVDLRVLRSALTVVERPRSMSQRTSERVSGIPPRPYLEAVRDFARDGGAVVELGHLRIVDVDAFVSWLGSRFSKTKPTSAKPTTDVLAAELGLVEVLR